jgi:cytidylate kinase
MKEIKDKFNITVASWQGVGSTTLSLILSYIYNMKYFYSGAVFRYVSEKLGYGSEGKVYTRNEDKYGDYLHEPLDEYSEHLLDRGNFVISTKPLGFIIDREDTFSIFLYADIKERAKRGAGDGRESIETIEEGLMIRQKEAGKGYKKYYNVDWEDIKLIESTHELSMDTTEMTIEEEVNLAVSKIKERNNVVPVNKFEMTGLSPVEIKKKATKFVKELDLELPVEMAIAEMYEHFKGKFSVQPEEIHMVFREARK